MEEFLLNPYVAGHYGNGLVFEYDKQIAGFITYSWNRQLLAKEIPRWVIYKSLFKKLIITPSVLLDILDAYWYSREKNRSAINAEIAFCAVSGYYRSWEFYQRTKLKIASMLFDKALDDLTDRSVSRVEAYTSAEKEMIAFIYASKKFTPTEKKIRCGRKRIHWVKNLAPVI
ncbi:MAG: hypothetical protein EPN22_13530 [Nitrospirae bacterium]|nr:MAG: hypothetical protein EPN22_13530 [Nitrospirota bacterium]